MTRILMHGCNGKMGRMITELVKNDDSAVITAGVDTYTGIPNDYPVFESISQCDAEADVVIDFSNAGAVDGLLDYCAEKKLPVVLCTTGLSEEQLQKVEKTSEKTAVLKSANMSLAAPEGGEDIREDSCPEVGEYVPRDQSSPEAFEGCSQGARKCRL